MLYIKRIIEKSEKYIYLLITIIDIKYFAIETYITDLVNDYIYH